MHTKAINPYSVLGPSHKNALDYLINHLPPDPQFIDLNTQLPDAFINPDPPEPSILEGVVPFLQVVLPNAYNAYTNAPATRPNYPYSETQLQLTGALLASLKTVPAHSMADLLSHTEEDIAAAGLTLDEQTPLLVAAALARSSAEYWLEQVNNPATPWVNYLNPNPALSYLNVNGFVEATVQGSLLSYGLMAKPDIQLLNIYISLVASVGLSAGKVLFGWMGKS